MVLFKLASTGVFKCTVHFLNMPFFFKVRIQLSFVSPNVDLSTLGLDALPLKVNLSYFTDMLLLSSIQPLQSSALPCCVESLLLRGIPEFLKIKLSFNNILWSHVSISSLLAFSDFFFRFYTKKQGEAVRLNDG